MVKRSSHGERWIVRMAPAATSASLARVTRAVGPFGTAASEFVNGPADVLRDPLFSRRQEVEYEHPISPSHGSPG